MTGTQRMIETIANRVLEREDELVATMLARNAAELVDYGLVDGMPDAADAVRESARGNLREAVAALRRDRRPPAALPREAVEEARAAVHAGLPLNALIHSYRIGHAVAWEAMVEEVERLELESEARRDLLQLLSRFVFAYVDALVPAVEREYAAEEARRRRTPTERVAEIVRDLLAGSTIDAHNLAYDLHGQHTAVIVTGGCAEHEVRRLAATLDRGLLYVDVSDTTAWAWLGGRAVFTPADGSVMRALVVADEVIVAFGGAGGGIAGFRESHFQARRAHRIGSQLGQSLTMFDDVAPEALALTSETAARDFVERTLAPLAQGDGDKLRETLDAYFAADLNAASAAARLGVSDRTVAYRLRRAEELMGAPLGQRRLELELALRIERVLGPPKATDA